MASRLTRVLVLCKTYPSPSAKHAETSCVAAMEEDGSLIRLYPVPFRLVADAHQFKKWQWINLRVEKAKADRRPESHKVFVDTIECDGDPISTKNHWAQRIEATSKIPVYDDFEQLDSARIASSVTLGLVRPKRIVDLEIKATERSEWTAEEKQKLLSLQRQANLFEESDTTSIATLRKLPYDFHYRYECEVEGQTTEYRHKLVDWEIGALYWNLQKSHGKDWEAPFRKKIQQEMSSRELIFLLGTVHRFPDQWLIVSLIYPPKQPTSTGLQSGLFD